MLPPKRKEYICYYEGLQEEKYFKRLKELIEKKYMNIRVCFKKVEKFEYFVTLKTNIKKIAVFDYDCDKTNFETKVKKCLKNNVNILYSNLNFDLWLILHKEQYTTPVSYNDDYQEKVKEIYKLPKNANIKTESNIDKILKQIELEDVNYATENAEKIMKKKNKKDYIKINGKYGYFPNPSLSVQDFLRNLEKTLNIKFK